MIKYLLNIYLLYFFIIITHQASSPSSPTYVAGVVEFAVESMAMTSQELVDLHTAEYVKIIESSSIVDILVFPEGTLNNRLTATYVPEPATLTAPCNDRENIYQSFFVKLSCAARKESKYVVINLTEMENCTANSQAANGDSRPCGDVEKGLNLYNTNVVFDRSGTVISRYRKINLFGELGISTEIVPQIATFTTDFNVTFGHFICFDLMFYTPAIEMINMGIRDIIFPTMWFSELPFLTAVQIQQNWAQVNNVNLLAAGASNPRAGSTGSGIYSGENGALTSVMAFNPKRQLYTATVYKKSQKIVSNDSNLSKLSLSGTPQEMLNLKLKKDVLDKYTTAIINKDLVKVDERLCFEDLCCQFTMELSKDNITDGKESYNYRMVVFDSTRTFDGYATGGVAVCGIVACTNENLNSCGERFTSEIVFTPEIIFHKIKITGQFETNEKILMLPNSLDITILPFHPMEYMYEMSEEYNIDQRNVKNITYELLSPRSDLLTFAIYGRNFNRDSGSSTIQLHFYQIILIISSCFLFKFY